MIFGNNIQSTRHDFQKLTEKHEDDSNAKLKLVMRFTISIVLLGIALFLLITTGVNDVSNFLFGAIVGYWLG